MENNKSSNKHNFKQKSTDYKKFNKIPIQTKDSHVQYNAYNKKNYENKHETQSKNPNYYQEHLHKISETSEPEFYYLTIQNLKSLHQYSGDILLTYLENLQPISVKLDKTKKLESFMDLIIDLLNKLCSIDNFRHAIFLKEFFLSKCLIENLIKKLKDFSELISEKVPKILLILKKFFITFLKYFRDLTFLSIKDCLECIETLIELQPNNKELKVLQYEFLQINSNIKSINLDLIKLKIEEKEKKDKIIKSNLENIEILYNNHPFHPTIEEISNKRPNNLIFPHIKKKKGPYGSLEQYLNNVLIVK